MFTSQTGYQKESFVNDSTKNQVTERNTNVKKLKNVFEILLKNNYNIQYSAKTIHHPSVLMAGKQTNAEIDERIYLGAHRMSYAT